MILSNLFCHLSVGENSVNSPCFHKHGTISYSKPDAHHPKTDLETDEEEVSLTH